MDLIFAAAGEFAVPTLRALLCSSHRIVQVISQPDRPSGRGRKLAPTAVSQLALESNLSLVRTDNINAESLSAADVMIVIAFGQKISPPIVSHPRLGSINLHASLLPKYRGAAPINHAILNGESITGNSIIRLANRMDAGAVLAQSRVEIGPLETAGELHDRLAQDGASLVLKTLDALASGAAVETPQDESQATLAPKLSRESTIVDWTKPASTIANQIRGLYPWPGCRFQLLAADGSKLDHLTIICGAAKASTATNVTPGTITEQGLIRCSESDFEIIQLQPQGKQPMLLSAYRNGHKWPARARLQSIS